VPQPVKRGTVVEEGFRLDGIAAVTGAGQGIGLGIAGALAERGVEVLALILEDSQRDAVYERVSGTSGKVEVQLLDVTDIGDFQFPSTLQVLVNNAGVRISSRPIEVIDEAEWRRTFDVNFFGTVAMTRLALPIMRAAQRGVICNISSGSLFSPIPFLGPYRASKAAVSAFSETLRVEVAPFGIRVIEILPGAVKTGINVNSILNVIADTTDEPAYLPMAEIQRAQAAGNPADTKSPDEVGRYIVDAIYDAGGPQRYGGDSSSQELLERWRTSTDEERAAHILTSYEAIIPR